MISSCHHLVAAQKKTPFVISLLMGEFSNGMKYRLIPSNQEHGRIVIRIGSVALPYNPEYTAFFYLLHHSMFEGTKNLTSQNIVDVLKKVSRPNGNFQSFNRDDPEPIPSHFIDIRYNEWNQELLFTFFNMHAVLLPPLLKMLNEVIFHPLLSDHNIEEAKDYLLGYYDFYFPSTNRLLETITPQEVRDFYAQWCVPEHMRLEIMGFTEEMIEKVRLYNLAHDENRCLEFTDFSDRPPIFDIISQAFGEIIKNERFTDHIPKWDFPMRHIGQGVIAQ